MNHLGDFFVSWIPLGSKRRLILWGWLALTIVLPLGVFAQSGPYSIGISNNDPFPATLLDTVSHTIALTLVNHDPSKSFSGPIDVMMKVNGDEPSVLAGFNINTPIPPGDSVKLPPFSHVFNKARFTGGGLTYDIIVWPMSIGPGESDTLTQAVTFIHTRPSADRIGLKKAPKGFPGEVMVGNEYDLAFYVVNLDTVNELYERVSLIMEGDGVLPDAIVLNRTLKHPVAPGDSVGIAVPGHVFDVATGGGGLTYDIIVWPMAIGASEVDTFASQIKIFDGAAIEAQTYPGAPLPDPVYSETVYEVGFHLINSGVASTVEPVDILIAQQGGESLRIYTHEEAWAVGDTISVYFNPFVLASMVQMPTSNGVYHWNLFARERGTENNLNRLSFTYHVENSTPSVGSFLSLPSGGTVSLQWTVPWDISENSYEIVKVKESESEVIAVIPAVSSPESPVWYETTDRFPRLGLNTYELIQVQQNAARKSMGTASATIFPQHLLNPGPTMSGNTGQRSERTIKISLDQASDLQLTWYDPSGRILHREQRFLPEGPQEWTVEIPATATEGVIYWSLSNGINRWSGSTINQ